MPVENIITQLTTLELDKKRTGMHRAASKNAEILQRMRAIAKSIAEPEINIDTVRFRADVLGVEYESGNYLGSLFNTDDWTWTGKVAISTHKGSHGRIVKIWMRRMLWEK